MVKDTQVVDLLWGTRHLDDLRLVNNPDEYPFKTCLPLLRVVVVVVVEEAVLEEEVEEEEEAEEEVEVEEIPCLLPRQVQVLPGYNSSSNAMATGADLPRSTTNGCGTWHCRDHYHEHDHHHL